METGPVTGSIEGRAAAIAPRRFFVSILFACLWANFPANAKIGWYTTEEKRCDGVSSLASPLRAGGWLAPDIDLVATASAAGNVHVRLDVKELRAVTAAKGALVLDSHVLDASSTPRVRDLFLGADTKVNWIVESVFDLIAGYIIKAEADLATKVLIEWLGERPRASIPLSSAAFIVAQGGVLQDLLTVYVGPDKRRRAVYTTVYTAPVGTETRTVVLYSCRYAVETQVSEFQTVGSNNNKVVRPDGGKWRVLDVDTNQYDRSILAYEGQDEEYFYFGVEGEPGERRRISFRGGPWQVFSQGRWKTLYARVDAH